MLWHDTLKNLIQLGAEKLNDWWLKREDAGSSNLRPDIKQVQKDSSKEWVEYSVIAFLDPDDPNVPKIVR